MTMMMIIIIIIIIITDGVKRKRRKCGVSCTYIKEQALGKNCKAAHEVWRERNPKTRINVEVKRKSLCIEIKRL
jgi:hypothetical protein